MAPLIPQLVQLIGFFFVALVLSNLAMTLVVILIKSFGWWSWDAHTGRFSEED